MSLLHPGTILVVDDDCGHAILITKALRQAHITNPITTLHDGQDAVDLCCATGQSTGGNLPLPLLMILDLRLPGLNGPTCSNGCKSRHRPGLSLSSSSAPWRPRTTSPHARPSGIFSVSPSPCWLRSCSAQYDSWDSACR